MRAAIAATTARPVAATPATGAAAGIALVVKAAAGRAAAEIAPAALPAAELALLRSAAAVADAVAIDLAAAAPAALLAHGELRLAPLRHVPFGPWERRPDQPAMYRAVIVADVALVRLDRLRPGRDLRRAAGSRDHRRRVDV